MQTPCMFLFVILSVTFAFAQLTFDKCTLNFTNHNYQIPQTVTVSVVPAFGTSVTVTSGANIVAYLCAPDTLFAFPLRDQNYPVKPNYFVPLSQCYVWGFVLSLTRSDPHIQPSFTNRDFSFQGGLPHGGYYYYIRSDTLEVQAHHVRWSDTTTVINKVAIRYKGSGVKFTKLAGNKCQLDYIGIGTKAEDISVGGPVNQQVQTNFVATLGDGTKVTIDCTASYINMRVDGSRALSGNATGICFENDKNRAELNNIPENDANNILTKNVINAPASVNTGAAAINTCIVRPTCNAYRCPNGQAGTPCAPCPKGTKSSGGSCVPCK